MNKIAQINFEDIAGKAGLTNQPASIGDLISRILPYVFAGAGIALLIYLLMGGFTLMFSAGDPKKVQEGKTIITHALIGFVIVFFAFWIVILVGRMLGLAGVTSIFAPYFKTGGVYKPSP